MEKKKSENKEGRNKSISEKIEIKNEFLNKMLRVCEVQSYNEIYIKIVKSHNEIIKCDEIFSQDSKYSIDKIRNDVASIPEILYLQLYDPRKLLDQNSQRKIRFKRLPYLVSLEGFNRVISNYRSQGIIGNDITWKRLQKLWGIRPEEEKKTEKFISDLIQSEEIKAEFKEKPELTLHFKSLMEIPAKRSKIFQLLLVIVLFAVSLAILLSFTAK
jgi:hypothetical protein